MDDIFGLKIPGAPQDPAALETAQLTTIVSDPPAAAPAAPLADPAAPLAAQPAPEAEAEPAAGPDMPDLQTDLPAPPQQDAAGIWENVSAAWTEDTIARDRRNYHLGKRRALSRSLYDLLPPEAQARVNAKRWDYENNWTDFEDLVLEEVGRGIARDPARYGGLPQTREAFDAQIIAEERAELEEAQAVLERPGGLITEFVGAAASTMASPAQAALMLAGGGVAPSVLRLITTEALLGGLSEAVDLPNQFDTAARLDLPEPDPVAQIGLGAVLGGGLAGAIAGAARLPSAYRGLRDQHAARRSALDATRPPGTSASDAEIAVDAAEAALRGDQTVAETIAPQPAPGTLGNILTPGAGFSQVLEAGAGYTVVRGPNGEALRREGTRAWRNNNPGNIEFGPFARSQGAIGTDGRFAVFPTYEAGRAAKEQLLWGSKSYRGMTIGQAINRYAPPFENNTQSYASTVARAAGATTATPMASLTPAQRKLMLDAMERVEGFKPGTENGVAAPAMRSGPAEDGSSFAGYGTSRGYTQSGQVSAGDDFRIDVDYEVVDLGTLFRASGDFQPRDRSRIQSDAWIADTAARLDPALLMPAPSADRGAPIVGPSGMIESGNGRYAAIERAYARHPDRAAAYRSQIEAAGFAIPEGVTRPVLVARRKSELTDPQLKAFTLAAQDGGVAAMTPMEVARASSRAMDGPMLAKLDPTQALTAESNVGFVRAALATLPRSARNALFDASGMLNREGARQLREALFARAWPDPDILARFAETDAAELKTLMDALDSAAPAWAALRADIEAGQVLPEMDIGGFVLDAMRLIGSARDIAARGGPKISAALDELLSEVDLIAGPVSPLTAALVAKFWRGGRAAKAEDVASFLTRYAEDARKAGASGALFDAPSPRDILARIDPATFDGLPADLGAARGYAQPAPRAPQALDAEGFDAGASSPEAQEADAAILESLQPPAEARPARLVDGTAMEARALEQLIGDLKLAQPYDTAEALHAAAILNHQALNDQAAAAASRLGLAFRPAPVKQMDRVIEKVTDKYGGDFRQIADVARTGLTAHSIADADAFVADLAQRFDLVDEGWNVTAEGYFDRKLIVIFEDGQLGEIQIWPPGMLAAKEERGGHKLYEIARDKAQSAEARAQAVADMRILYAEVAQSLDPSFAQKLGIDAPRAASTSAASASDSSVARSSRASSSANAREGSSGDQEPSRPSSFATPASERAANSDPSNFTSFMGEGPFSNQDTLNMGAAGQDVNSARAALDGLDDFADVPIELPDGTTVSVRDVLADLEADTAFDAFIQACAITPAGAAQ
jgi:hypothetical protein